MIPLNDTQHKVQTRQLTMTNQFVRSKGDIVMVRAGFKYVEALGRIIIRGQSGGVLVWLSVWCKVQTTL